MSLEDRMKQVIRQDVQSMHAYAIQPSAGFVKLDAMENPFRLPPELQRELGERLGRVAINRYPTQCVADVIAALTTHVKPPPGCKLMLGNGSDELISLLALACDVPGNTILAPLPGFVMYEMSAKLQGLKFVGVPLTASFELDETAMLAAIEQHRPAITYIAYPNNPTANLFDDRVVDRIVAAVGAQQGLVVFDEAYQPFSSKTWMQRMGQHVHGEAAVDPQPRDRIAQRQPGFVDDIGPCLVLPGPRHRIDGEAIVADDLAARRRRLQAEVELRKADQTRILDRGLVGDGVDHASKLLFVLSSSFSNWRK